MLTATLAVSAITLTATILHLKSQQQNSSISTRELWKIRQYQEDGTTGANKARS